MVPTALYSAAALCGAIFPPHKDLRLGSECQELNQILSLSAEGPHVSTLVFNDIFNRMP